MSVCYNDTLYGSELVVLSYVDDYLYWYTSEELGKLFMDTIENIFHVKCL